MGYVVMRRLGRGFRGLGAVEESSPGIRTFQRETAVAPMSFPSEWMVGGGGGGGGGSGSVSLNPGAAYTGAEQDALRNAGAEVPGVDPDMPQYQTHQFILEGEGEVVEETVSPGGGGGTQVQPIGGNGGINWRVWAPIGLITVGLLGAVWIIRS